MTIIIEGGQKGSLAHPSDEEQKIAPFDWPNPTGLSSGEKLRSSSDGVCGAFEAAGEEWKFGQCDDLGLIRLTVSGGYFREPVSNSAEQKWCQDDC